jgi:hypothetical protein
MPGTLTRHYSRLTAAAILTASAAGTAILATTPANAAFVNCTRNLGHSVNSLRIIAFDSTECTTNSGGSSFVINFPVTISRIVGATSTQVASGLGSATYVCNGTAENEYSATGPALDDVFTAACG